MKKNIQFRTYRLPARLIVAGAVVCMCGWAQTSSESPEDFRFEITGSAWIMNTGGAIQANGAPVDFVSDLGVQQEQPTFYGQLVFKPGRKHRIIVEGTPFDIHGYNTIDRSVTYRGYTYAVDQTLRSTANMNYLFAGYQYDLLSGRMGHFGVSGGAAYLGATGTIQALQAGVTESKSITVGMPLAGAEFRLFPIPGHRIFEIDGGMRGMGFGSYGHYVEANGNAGIAWGPITFQAGYRAVNADLHVTNDGGSGLTARLQGPTLGVLWRW